MKKVNCLGVIVVDALNGPIPHYPVPKVKTQVVAETLLFMPGGGAANTGAALGQMGVQVGVFSKVGKDPNGTFVIHELEKHGVDTFGICISGSDTTPFTFVAIHPDGDRTFIHTPGANKTFSLADLDRDLLLYTDFLFYQDLWVLPKIDGKPGAELLAEAQKRGVVTLMDECWGLGPNRETFEMMLPFVDYVLPSFDDMSAIYPGYDPEEIIKILHQRGAKRIVLKMGKKGCIVSSDGEEALIPSFATKIVDTTGAGDCFDAGFVAGLVHSLSDRESAIIGCKAASACIQHIGGASGIPLFEILRG